MAQERFLLNPWKANPKKKAKKVTKRKKGASMAKKRSKRKSGKGSHLSAAHRAKIAEGVRKAARRKNTKRITKGKKHRITVYKTGPKVLSRTSYSKTRKAGYRINMPKRRRKSARRNPPLSKIQKMLPLMGTGAVSVILTTMAPGLVPQSAGNPIVKYGIMAGVAVGGGMVADKMLGKDHGVTFVATGGAIIMADIIKTYILSKIFPGLSDYDLEDYDLEDYELDAFPGELDAFPGELDGDDDMDMDDAYSDMGDNSPY